MRGNYPDMREAVARAIELGITYFDTASLYGNGQSEVNLGAVLRELQERDKVVIGTKVRIRHAAGTQGTGVIAIRVLAGGALSGVMERHPVAASAPNPIASA